MSDLPDWVQSTSNLGTILAQQTVNAGNGLPVDVSNNTSVIINVVAQSSAVNTWVRVRWSVAVGGVVYTNTSYMTAGSHPLQLASVAAESPIYGAGLLIDNLGTDPLSVTVIGSSRVVPAFRILNANTPSRHFQFIGAAPSVVFNILAPADTGDANYASNGQSMIAFDATLAGVLVVNYVGLDGVAVTINLATLTANQHIVLFFALPQAMVYFSYLNTGVGSLSAALFVTPAQI